MKINLLRAAFIAVASASIAIAPTAGLAQTCSSGFGTLDLSSLADARRNRGSEINMTLQPAIAKLGADLAKIYACKDTINFYAAKLGMPDDIVHGDRAGINDLLVIEFRNKVNPYPSVCGSIRYDVPPTFPDDDGAQGAGAAVKLAYKDILTRTRGYVEQTEGQIASEVSNLIQPYLPTGKTLPRPRGEYLVSIVRGLQEALVDAFIETVERRKLIPPDNVHLLRSSRCASILPTIAGPRERLLAYYPSAFSSYLELKPLLDTAMKQ